MVKGTIVLEGGAARGIFTSGILDFLMEQDMYFSNVIGVSAGSCNAISYVSKQIGRAKKTVMHTEYPFKYINLRKALKTRSLMDMEVLFESIPNEMYPFDYDTFFQSKLKCHIGVTNCHTGKIEFLEVEEGEDELMKTCRASSSLPLLAPIIPLNGIPYLDGGLADSVPVEKALEIGEEKIIIIMTQQRDYRKSPNVEILNRIYKRVYKEYPELVECMRKRYQTYNGIMDRIIELEDAGKVFVLRPTIKPVGRLEDDPEIMENFYAHGYDMMKDRYQELLEYLAK